MSNAHSYAVIEHQLRHLGTVNQYDLLHRGRVLDGLGTESRRCNEDFFARSLARQGTDTAQADDYGRKLATLALHPRLADTGPADVITHTLAVAEFLARESRSGTTRER